MPNVISGSSSGPFNLAINSPAVGEPVTAMSVGQFTEPLIDNDVYLYSLVNHVPGKYLLKAVKQFTTLGTGSYTIPDDVTAIRIRMVAGGGSGGGSSVNFALIDNTSAGSGGAGGSFVEAFISGSDLTSIPNYPNVDFFIGSGALGVTGSNGLQGQDSWFGSSSTLRVTGGDGGTKLSLFGSPLDISYSTDNSGGTLINGLGSGAIVTYKQGTPGGQAMIGIIASTTPSITGSIVATPGRGGDSPLGTGGSIAGVLSSRINTPPSTQGIHGVNGVGYGAGGSGAASITGVGSQTRYGGSGTQGIIIIEEYVSGV